LYDLCILQKIVSRISLFHVLLCFAYFLSNYTVFLRTETHKEVLLLLHILLELLELQVQEAS
jgi:hypothetical protein